MTPNPNRLDLLDRLIDEFKVDGVVEMTLQPVIHIMLSHSLSANL